MDTFRKNAIKIVEYDTERFKVHHSGCSYGNKWLFKCFHHFFETYDDIDLQTKEKIQALLSSIKEQSSDIEQKIDLYANDTKEKILTAKSDGLTPTEFQKVLTKSHAINEYFDDKEGISAEWKEFYKDFYTKLDEVLNQVIQTSRETNWYKSLSKIQRICKKREDLGRIHDYYCLKERFCIVCNKKSHRIDYDEEL